MLYYQGKIKINIVKKWKLKVIKLQEKIKYFLNTKIIGNKIIFYSEIDSTQKEIRKLAEQKIENGTIVVTEYQTNGIGTHNRSWISEKGVNVTFSLVLYPTCKLNELDTITYDIAACIVETIKEISGHTLEIKIPNDIMCKGKKLGGILTQIVTAGEKIKYLLIGIGINVNEVEFPQAISNIATSLKKEFKEEFLIEEIIAKFCNKFEEYCFNSKILLK